MTRTKKILVAVAAVGGASAFANTHITSVSE